MPLRCERCSRWSATNVCQACSQASDFQGVSEASDSSAVDHPRHYTEHPSGVECIQITEHMNFNLGNAVKYLWRAGLKESDPTRDLEKARWYITRELERVRDA